MCHQSWFVQIPTVASPTPAIPTEIIRVESDDFSTLLYFLKTRASHPLNQQTKRQITRGRWHMPTPQCLLQDSHTEFFKIYFQVKCCGLGKCCLIATSTLRAALHILEETSSGFVFKLVFPTPKKQRKKRCFHAIITVGWWVLVTWARLYRNLEARFITFLPRIAAQTLWTFLFLSAPLTLYCSKKSSFKAKKTFWTSFLPYPVMFIFNGGSQILDTPKTPRTNSRARIGPTITVADHI